MSRLFLSYKRDDADYAFAVRQWLIDTHGWGEDDIFVDLSHLTGGPEYCIKARKANGGRYTAIVVEKVIMFGGPHVQPNTNNDDMNVPVSDGIKGAGQPIALVE